MQDPRLIETYTSRPDLVSKSDNLDKGIQFVRNKTTEDGRVMRAEFYVALQQDLDAAEFYTPVVFEHATFCAIDAAIAALERLKKQIILQHEGIIPASEMFERLDENKQDD